jgi:hypothetical protein
VIQKAADALKECQDRDAVKCAVTGHHLKRMQRPGRFETANADPLVPSLPAENS